MRIIIMLGILCCVVMGAWADLTPASLTWPEWRVETTEYYDTPGYPISWMFDRNPATAWVYHYKPYSLENEQPQPKSPHGIGVQITIGRGNYAFHQRCLSFLLDGIGIINGYAKSRRLYKHNNRITALRISVERSHGVGTWEKTFHLRDTLKMQHLRLPRMYASVVTLTVQAVAIGKDDDLCISELSLFSHGKQIPWKLPPYVISSLGHPVSDADPTPNWYSVTDWHGHDVKNRYLGNHDIITCMAWQPGTPNMLLAVRNDKDKKYLYLYDTSANRILSHHQFHEEITNIGWINVHTALVWTNEGNIPSHWFRLTFPADRIRSTKALIIPRDSNYPFLPGAWQYGE